MKFNEMCLIFQTHCIPAPYARLLRRNRLNKGLLFKQTIYNYSHGLTYWLDLASPLPQRRQPDSTQTLPATTTILERRGITRKEGREILTPPPLHTITEKADSIAPVETTGGSPFTAMMKLMQSLDNPNEEENVTPACLPSPSFIPPTLSLPIDALRLPHPSCDDSAKASASTSGSAASSPRYFSSSHSQSPLPSPRNTNSPSTPGLLSSESASNSMTESPRRSFASPLRPGPPYPTPNNLTQADWKVVASYGVGMGMPGGTHKLLRHSVTRPLVLSEASFFKYDDNSEPVPPPCINILYKVQDGEGILDEEDTDNQDSTQPKGEVDRLDSKGTSENSPIGEGRKIGRTNPNIPSYFFYSDSASESTTDNSAEMESLQDVTSKDFPLASSSTASEEGEGESFCNIHEVPSDASRAEPVFSDEETQSYSSYSSSYSDFSEEDSQDKWVQNLKALGVDMSKFQQTSLPKAQIPSWFVNSPSSFQLHVGSIFFVN